MYVLRTKRDCGLSEVHAENEETDERQGSRLIVNDKYRRLSYIDCRSRRVRYLNDRW
jgi:hypothetical protein